MKALLFAIAILWQSVLSPLSTDSTVVQQEVHPLIEKGGVPVDADSTIFLFNGIGPYSLKQRVQKLRTELENLKSNQQDLREFTVKYESALRVHSIRALLPPSLAVAAQMEANVLSVC